jgi:hypothetical protein
MEKIQIVPTEKNSDSGKIHEPGRQNGYGGENQVLGKDGFKFFIRFVQRRFLEVII